MYLRSDVKSLFILNNPITDLYCYVKRNVPVEYLRAKITLQKKQPGNTWAVCQSTSNYYSPSPDNRYGIHLQLNTTQSCGAGTYRNLATAHLKNGGTWLGGTLSSTDHTF